MLLLLLLLLLLCNCLIIIIIIIFVLAGLGRWIQPYTTVYTTFRLRLTSVNGYYIFEQCFVVRGFGHRVQAAHYDLIQMAPFQQCHVTAQNAFNQCPSLQFHILGNAKPIAQVVQPDAYQIVQLFEKHCYSAARSLAGTVIGFFATLTVLILIMCSDAPPVGLPTVELKRMLEVRFISKRRHMDRPFLAKANFCTGL
ncbi:hypothetical protein T4E_7444 [Trichinella pseudospiralis]|uniref:Uncharacterized protein n=1 Tax=Trichinella pseudospiralis TaxID=6337 RepID=A0A0V0XV81_TRIPS|nr:hypothetical protein T4E_7444 [Trichinella pseudospiralis]